MSDPDCICRGNWRQIVKEYEPLINRQYAHASGTVYRFFGLVHGDDDYYYGMIPVGGGRLMLVTCVGEITTAGFTLLPATPPTEGAG